MKEWINPQYIATIRIMRMDDAGYQAAKEKEYGVFIGINHGTEIKEFDTLAEAEQYYNDMVKMAKPETEHPKIPFIDNPKVPLEE